MKKKLIGVVAIIAMLTVGLLGMSPVSASAQNVCVVGAATAQFDTLQGLHYPGVGPAVTASGTISGGSALCAIGGLGTASGTFAVTGNELGSIPNNPNGRTGGWCGHSKGSGTVNDGTPHTYEYTSAGTLLIQHGPQVRGFTNAIAISGVDGSNSCRTGTARTFTISGVLALT